MSVSGLYLTLLHAAVLSAISPCFAGNPLWNGAGSTTNNFFSNTNNWVAGNVPPANNVNGLPVNFGPLAAGATNTANCDATGNSGAWTFNSGTPSMMVTLNPTNQLGATVGPDVFVNNSTNLQTITGGFRLFDISGITATRRFAAASGPLLIGPATITLRGDSSPTVWALELAGSATGSALNCVFANGGNLGGKNVNLIKTGSGTWEVISALPDLTTNATSVTVAGGTLSFDTGNSYTGVTVISNDAVLMTVTAATGAGAYSVSNAATLGVALSAAGSSLTNASLVLGTQNSDATTINFDLGGFSNPVTPVITVTGPLTVNGIGVLNITGTGLAVGQFPLIQYGSQTGAASLVLGSVPGNVTTSLSNNVANSSIDLVVTPPPVSWSGNVNSLWDINTTANWQINGVPGQYYQDGSSVVLDDTAAGNFAVTVNAVVNPASVTANNSVNNYSVSGSGGIGGNGALSVSGTAALTLSTANSYAGPTLVNSGALVLSNLNAVAGSSFFNIADGAVVQPKLGGTYANVPAVINGSSRANSSFGGSLDFHGGGAATVTWPGPINLNSPTATIGCYNVAGIVTLSGQLTGSGSLTIRPEGGSAAGHTATFILSNPTNDYAGSTTMLVGTAELSSTLKLGVKNGLPPSTTLNLNRAGTSGTVYFDLAGCSQTLSGLTSSFTSNAVINSSGAGALIISNAVADTFNGDLGAPGKANFSVTKMGSGTLTLGGPNVYSGATTIGAGTLIVTGQVTSTSGLILSNNATLQVALGGSPVGTNIWVNGNVTLAGQVNILDAGIVSNSPYPVVYYSGTLNTNGMSVAPLAPWAFTIDTSMPHLVRLIPTQQFPLAQFTNGNFAVSTLTTNLGGILRGTPRGPIWYELRDQTNKLWDFGAAQANSPWSITVRHLRAGTNTVTVFAQNTAGAIQSNSVQLTLTLGPDSGVRPRPIPAEIWWGGISDNTGMTNYSQWTFVQKYQDGYFFHSAGWSPAATSWLQQSLARNLLPFNTKYWPELGGDQPNPTTNSAASQLNNWGSWAASCEANGIIWSEFTHDYHMENMQPVCQANPSWPTNDDIAWWTGDLSIASPNYPYSSGIWRDIFNGYYQKFPHVKVGETSQPEWWPWGNFPAGVGNKLAFTITNDLGQPISFSLNASNILASFVNMAGAIGDPYFSLQSDSPWDYFGGGVVGTPASEATMRRMIRAYEQYFQSRGGRHSLICNVSNAGTNQQGSITAADNHYESSSLSSMYLHQQEGGRANRYLFESWYWGIPYVVVPETQPGSYTHLALSAIKYLKGVADTNGNLEQLNLTALATSGALKLLQLQNNGDVMCLPAINGQAGNVPGVTTRYFSTNGVELTPTILTAEGLCYTNQLQPGGTTNLIGVTLASGLTAATNDNACLEAFWNPQDPLGIVRDREWFTNTLSPLGLWSEADVGSPGVPGGSAIAGTNLTLLGSGGDIGGSSDSFHFLWQTNTGDGTITARVTAQMFSDPRAKAGVMIRESSVANAKNVFLCITPGAGVSFQNRPSAGGSTYNVSATGRTAPYWLRLARSAMNFTAQCSPDGITWTTLGSSNLTGFATTASWGLAVGAHNNALGSAANFDNVSLPNAAPVLAAISNRTIIAGQTLSITNSATDANSQTLTYGLPTAPTNAMISAVSGLLTWRPTISQSPSSNSFSVVVTDNGQPPLSATQSFVVTVNVPPRPGINSVNLSQGGFSLVVNGDAGPDYFVQAATNLVAPVNWVTLLVTNSPALPFLFTDTSATNSGRRFYRIQLGP